MSYIFEKTTDFDNIFGEDSDGLQLFFAHVFSFIGLIFKKLQAKMYFLHCQNNSALYVDEK